MLSDHSRDAIRAARERFRQRTLLKDYGDYIEKLLPWDWFCTITFKRLTSRSAAVIAIRRFLDALEEAAGQPIGWVLVEDYGKLGGRLHAHLLIAGVRHLDDSPWWRRANRRFGSTQITLYVKGEGGAHYIAKHILSCSGNLHMGGKALEPKNI